MNMKNILIVIFTAFGVLSIISCEKKLSSTKVVVKATGPKTANDGPLIAIGESFGGGIIFYVDSTKKHGLIGAANQALRAKWGCIGKLIGGTSAAIGSGQANTLAIVNACDTANTAARLCDQLVLNGFSDWFLPSKEELKLLFLNKTIFRGLKTDYYWSSTETNATNAECQDFYDGHRLNYEKNRTYYVRAIRAF